MNNLCFYHSADLDGHCSGAIIKNAIPDCWCYGINYYQPFKWDVITPDTTVYMVDFSLPIQDMIKLNNMCNLIWIDHHNTAINDYNKSGATIEGLREIGLAGCELTYRYIYKTNNIPTFVRLLGRYDVWDHEDPDVLPFQYGMGCYITFPNNDIWVELLKTNPKKVDDIIAAGRIIQTYVTNSDQRICKTATFDIDFENYHFLAINRAFISSKFFDSKFDNTIYDGMMTFSYNDKAKKWGFSLYTDKDIDLSQIAKKYGGGGHKQACGFSVDTPTMLHILKLS